MHKGLAAAAAVLVSALVAGCGGGLVGGETEPSKQASPAPPSTSSKPTESKRRVPAKSLELADKCSVVPEKQAQELGADQPPRERASNGVPGCSYDLGVSGAGFMAFVAVDKSETMQEYAEMRKSSAEPSEVAGYPAVEVAAMGTNCFVSVDIADQGSLFVSGLVPKKDQDPCELAKKFAEAAVKNLPDA